MDLMGGEGTPQLPHPQLEQSPLQPQVEQAQGPILAKVGGLIVWLF